jgi:DNA-binding MarR family transcriptional regulator
VRSTLRSSKEISVATRRLDVALASLHVALARRLGVSQPELAAITHVSTAGELGPTELAHRLGVTTGAVTALVDRLAQRGHLTREPHPADRRRLEIHVTDHARDEVLRHILPLTADTRALADTFSVEQRDAIGRFLEELTAIVRHHADSDAATR